MLDAPAHGVADGITPEQIDACRRGDRQALEAVFRAHAAMLERLLARLVGPRADVEDLLQETFTQAILSFPKFRGDAAVGTWLYRIAVNMAYKHLRRPHQRRSVSLELVGDAANPCDNRVQPDRRAELRQTIERLYSHLDQLDAPKRIAFILHVINDQPIAEVAALMGASRSATKSRVFWARRLLFRRLRRDPEMRAWVAPVEET